MPASHALADKGGGKKPKGASISNGDAAILRFLAAAEILERIFGSNTPSSWL